MAAGQQRRKFTPEFRDEAVRLVLDTGKPIAMVARDIGVVEGTLGNWVNLWRVEHAGEEPELSISERAELAQLRRDNQTLRMEREFLKKAAAFFATEQNR
jgi:transposase-like protein